MLLKKGRRDGGIQRYASTIHMNHKYFLYIISYILYYICSISSLCSLCSMFETNLFGDSVGVYK